MKKLIFIFFLFFAFAQWGEADSGSVTQANMEISAVDGTAFVDFSSANVLTNCLDCLVVIKDSSNRVIWGYIKAAGTGETYLDIVSGNTLNGNMEAGDPPTGWNAAAGTTLSSVADERTGGSGTKSCNILAGGDSNYWTPYRKVGTSLALYRATAWVRNVDATKIGILFYDGIVYLVTLSSQITGTSWVQVGPIYRTHHATYDLFVSGDTYGANKNMRIDDIVCQQVLTPSTTGVTIVSEKGGTTYNWGSKNANFNYNDSSGYTYELQRSGTAIRWYYYGGGGKHGN